MLLLLSRWQRGRRYGHEIITIIQPNDRDTWQGLLSIVGVPYRRGQRTLVRVVGRRVLQWRMFWHEADGSVLAGTGRNFGFGTLPRRRVFDLDLRRWRWWLNNLTFGSGLFDLYITVELFKCDFSRYSINNEHTFFLAIVPLVSFEHCIGYSGSIQMRHRHCDLLVAPDLQGSWLIHVHTGRFEIILYRVEHGPWRRIRKGRPQLQLANLGIKVQSIVHLPHGDHF